MHLRRWIIMVISITFFGGGIAGHAQADETQDAFECGPLALYLLAEELKTCVSLDDLGRIPGGKATQGITMKELQQEARKCGLALVAIRLEPNKPFPSYPVLALVQDGEHGHYIVVRAVGTSGRLLQVIDPSNPPIVMDSEELYASPKWSNKVLAPRSRVYMDLLGGFDRLAMTLFALCAFIASFILWRGLRNHSMLRCE